MEAAVAGMVVVETDAELIKTVCAIPYLERTGNVKTK